MIPQLTELARSVNTVLVLTLGAGGSIAFQVGFTLSFFQQKDIQKSLYIGSEQGRIAARHYGGVPWRG